MGQLLLYTKTKKKKTVSGKINIRRLISFQTDTNTAIWTGLLVSVDTLVCIYILYV